MQFKLEQRESQGAVSRIDGSFAVSIQFLWEFDAGAAVALPSWRGLFVCSVFCFIYRFLNVH